MSLLPNPDSCCNPCGDSFCLPSSFEDIIEGLIPGTVGIINVTESHYGAVGDGTTDNTAALRSAFLTASINGYVVYFPAGTYKTRQLFIYSNLKVVGAGRELSIIRFVDPTNTIGMLSADETVPVRNFKSLNIGFQIPAAGTNIITAIRFKNIGYSEIRFCRFDLSDKTLNTRTALDLDGNGGTATTYYNTIAANQFVNCYSGVALRAASNANRIIENNVFLTGFYGVTINESVQNTIENNSFQDLNGGIGVNLTGTTQNAFNVVRANFFETMDYGVYVAGTVQLYMIQSNNYSGIGVRTYHIASPNPGIVIENDFASFQDVGQLGQAVQLREYPLSITPPGTDAAYIRALFTVPRSATNPSAGFIQLQRADTAYEMVPFALCQNLVGFVDGDTTPSVRYLTYAVTVNSAPTTITDFDDEFSGQSLFIVVRDNNTTFNFTPAGNLRGNSGQSYKASNGDIIQARVDDNGVWWCIVQGATQGHSTSPVFGLEVVGITGSSYDITLVKPDKSAAIMAIQTGTTLADFFNSISVSGFSNQRIYGTANDPNGVVSASVGSICLSQNGVAGKFLFVKESDSGGNTGWTAK